MTDSRDDRIVAEFGDGHAVEDIAARYGLTVAQVYMVVEREVGPAAHPPAPGHHAPPAHGSPPPRYHTPAAYAPAPHPGFPPPGYRDVDTIVAEYGAGYDVQWIAYKHGLTVEWIYYLVGQAVRDEPGA
ncbi:hypothetical protein [Actinoplanes sp. NPDC049802]|uniref:hypothetical protein n=1 Tax=Actinoplanes sp. NPDC049802 TaxID=3154742 RepID=UPI0033E61148